MPTRLSVIKVLRPSNIHRMVTLKKKLWPRALYPGAIRHVGERGTNLKRPMLARCGPDQSKTPTKKINNNNKILTPSCVHVANYVTEGIQFDRICFQIYVPVCVYKQENVEHTLSTA